MSRTENILRVDSDRSTTRVPDPAHRAPPARAFSGRAGLSSSARTGFALVLANVRYWSTVAPIVRGQLARWEQAARAIGDPELRVLATSKLREEHFNAQVAATLATLAPRAERARVTEAIVALQVMYDYLDVLSEQPPEDPPPDDRHLFAALTNAVALALDGERGPATGSAREDYYAGRAYSDDGGYLHALIATINSTLVGLPSAGVIAPVVQAGAARCAEAQILNHRSASTGIDQLREWAMPRAAGTGLSWPQFLAGASASVLALGALLAAAADSTTTLEDAANLDRLYLSIGALTMLDSLVDFQEDFAAGQLGYVQYYDDPEKLAAGLATLARDAVGQARILPNGAHHIVTLIGVVAYYASAPAAGDDALTRPTIARVKRELAPLMAPTLALMRGWRLAKRAHWRIRHEARHA